MAHFAELDSDNNVLRVVVISNDDIKDEDGIENEKVGINFCKSLYGENTKWVQTSYNGKFRGKYASTDDKYNPVKDEFYMNPDILAAQQAALAEYEAKAAQRQALLDKLGITEQEARLLLG